MFTWFKQLKIFHYQTATPLALNALDSALANKKLKPCPKVSLATIGWISPFSLQNEVLAHTASPYALLAFAREERILPTSVIREKVEEKIADIEQTQGRQVSSKEKASIREDIQAQLLPQAFTHKPVHYLYLDTKKHYLMLSTTNANRCLQIIELLSQTLEGFKAYPLEVKKNISDQITLWVQNDQCPANFLIEGNCDMLDEQDEQAKIKFSRQNLASKEVVEHLKIGNKVTKLSLSFGDKLKFTLDQNFNFSGIKFLNLVKQRQESFCESKEQQLDADFYLMATEFSQWVDALLPLLGGVKEEAF